MNRPQTRHCCEACGQPVDDIEQPIELDGLCVDDNVVRYDGREVKVLYNTARLLRLLMARGAVSHEAFLIALETEAESDVSSVYAFHVRKALTKLGTPFTVRTVYGWGYDLRGADGNVVVNIASIAERAVGRPSDTNYQGAQLDILQRHLNSTTPRARD